MIPEQLDIAKRRINSLLHHSR